MTQLEVSVQALKDLGGKTKHSDIYDMALSQFTLYPIDFSTIMTDG